MTRNLKAVTAAVTAACGLAALSISSAAQAQSTATAERASWIPYTSNGYVGLSGGVSDFDRECLRGFGCDDDDSAWKVYTGGKFRNVLGVELAYVDLGKFAYGFGDERARGINLSGLANLPLGERFSVFGKLGSTYSWTETSLALAGARNGKEKGFGLSHGAGLDFNLTPNVGLRAEWERQRFHFVNGKSDIESVMVGAKVMF